MATQFYHSQGPKDKERSAYFEQCTNRDAGYKQTYHLPGAQADPQKWEQAMMKDAKCTRESLPTHYTSEEKEAVVELGNKAIADSQRQEDDEAGGLVAQAMRGYGYKVGKRS